MENGKHLLLEGEKLTVTHVGKIIGNNNKSIVLTQSGQTLTVTGNNLNVTEVNLESGRLTATGDVTEIKFSSETGGRDLLKKLFK